MFGKSFQRQLRAKTATSTPKFFANESLTVVLNFGEFGVEFWLFAQLRSKFEL